MTLNANEMYPALTGGVVTQRHTDLCARIGCATHKVDGVESPYCPRCGEPKDVEPAEPQESSAYWKNVAEVARRAHHAVASADLMSVAAGASYDRSRDAFLAAIHVAYPDVDKFGVYGVWLDCMESVEYCADQLRKMGREDRRRFVAMGGGLS